MSPSLWADQSATASITIAGGILPFALGLLVGLAPVVWCIRCRQAPRHRAEQPQRDPSPRADAHLRGVFEHAPDALLVCNAAGRMVMVNRQAEMLLGYRRRELMRQPVNALLQPRQADTRSTATLDLMHPASDDGQACGHELELRAESGEEIPVDVRLGRIEHRGRTYVIAAIRDLRERRRAERRRQQLQGQVREHTVALRRSREELQAIVDNSPVLIQVKDRDGRYTLVNRRWCEFAGRTEEEVLGRSDETLFPPEMAARMARDDEVVLDRGQSRHFEETREPGERETGEPETGDAQRVLDTCKFPLSDDDGRNYGLCGVSYDITERKQQETELRRARDQAQESSRAKTAFLANMSHELRTPINSIIGMTHLALAGNLPPQQRDYVGRANQAADELRSMIDNILDFSRIEAGRLNLEAAPFRLEDVLQSFSRSIAPQAAAKGLELVVDRPSELPDNLVGDPLRLSQALVGLGNNAVKFTEHGKITLRLRFAEHGTGQVVLHFSISDTGIGVSETAQAELFEPFRQGDESINRRFGGAGLGLAICRRLMELMGGGVWVESEPGLGSTFHASARCDRRTESDTVSGRPERHERVLVVDDNAIARGILAMLVESLGLETDTADDGEAAVEALRRASAERQAYDFVFLDWHLPRRDGASVARCVFADPHIGPKPRIAMVTAYGDEHAVDCLKDLNIVDFLVKPVSAVAVEQALQRPPKTENPPATAADQGNDAPATTAPDRGGEHAATPARPRSGVKTTAAAAPARPMLARFCKEYRGFADQFAAAEREPRADARLRLAHTLKGVAGNLGLSDIAGDAKALERACRDGAAAATLSELIARIETQLESLAEAVATPDDDVEESSPCCEVPPMSAAQAAEVQRLAGDLQGLIDGGDAAALEAAGRLVAAVDPDSVMGRHLAELSRRIQGFEFAAAAAQLRTLMPFIGRLGASAGEASGATELDALFHRLGKLLDDDDTEAETLATELAERLGDDKHLADQARLIAQHIDDFDYTAARSALEALRQQQSPEAAVDRGATNRPDR